MAEKVPDIAAAAVMVKSEEMPAGAEVVKVLLLTILPSQQTDTAT